MTTISTYAHLEHQQLQNNIHLFRVHKATARAIEDWLFYQSRFQAQQEAPVLCLVSYEDTEPPPIAVLLQKLTQWLRQHPDHGWIYVAVVTDNLLVARLVQNALKMLPMLRLSVVFMSTNCKEQALAHLLEKGQLSG